MQNDSNLNNIIIFSNVGKIYPPDEVALRNVTFEVKEGEFVCIIGPSGGGKSTILKIMAGLENQFSGAIAKPENISMVFQSGALFPWLSVFDNVAMGLRALNFPESKTKEECLRYIKMMELDGLIEKYPRELSGGQRQRVGIARALAVNPSILLLDEPFSALDAKTTEELHQDIIKIWRETKKTIIMVSHLIEEALSLADRVILMKNFTVDKIFNIELPRPRHEQGEAFTKLMLEVRKEFFK